MTHASLRRRLTALALAPFMALLAACGGSDAGGDGMSGGSPEPAPPTDRGLLVEKLAAGEPVFGVFSGPQTAEQGARMARESDADFILYSLESGDFDMETLDAYLRGMEAEAGPQALDSLPVILRVPPIADGAASADRLARALPLGLAGITFPHAATPEQAALAVELLPRAWPADPDGELLNVLIVEDREGISHVEEIVNTRGVSVVFAGPGDLRRAYEGDMEAVETAIQAVLSACLAADVPCGVTAGVADIGTRLDEGWRVIIVTEPEAVAAGRTHLAGTGG